MVRSFHRAIQFNPTLLLHMQLPSTSKKVAISATLASKSVQFCGTVPAGASFAGRIGESTMKSSLVVNALAGGAVSAPLMEPTVAKRRMTLRQARLRAAKGVNELPREADVAPGPVSGSKGGDAGT